MTLTSHNIDRHQKKQKNQTTRCTKHRQAPKKPKIPATTQKWTHSSWNFSFFGFFGACAGLVHLVVCFFWCLCRFGDSDFTKHRQAPKKQKKTKNPATTQKWTHSSWKFYFFLFFWCLCRFGASSGLVFLFFLVPVQVWWLWLHKTLTGTKKTQKNKPLDAPNIDRHQKNKKKQKFQQLLRSGPIVPGILVFLVFLVPVQVWCI